MNLTKTQKVFHVIFRVIVFATFLAACAAFVTFINFGIACDDSYLSYSATLKKGLTACYSYYVLLGLGILSVIFSVICCKCTQVEATVVRTIFMAIATGISFIAMSVYNYIFTYAREYLGGSYYRIFDRYGYDVGDISENSIIIAILCIVFTGMVYFVLSVTSIVALAKKPACYNYNQYGYQQSPYARPGMYNNMQGYPNMQGGYHNNMQGYPNMQGGYHNNPQGYPNMQGGYHNNMQGQPNMQGGYYNNPQGYPNMQGGYSNPQGQPGMQGGYSSPQGQPGMQGGYSSPQGQPDMQGANSPQNNSSMQNSLNNLKMQEDVKEEIRPQNTYQNEQEGQAASQPVNTAPAEPAGTEAEPENAQQTEKPVQEAVERKIIGYNPQTGEPVYEEIPEHNE